MHTKINNRKKNCLICGVRTGSRHSKDCVYAYKLPDNSKRIKRHIGLIKKLRLIIAIVKD